MSNVVQFRRKPQGEYDCPSCGCCPSIANVGRVHWGICTACKVRWRIGENLFSSWREENQEIWDQNRQELEQYREIA